MSLTTARFLFPFFNKKKIGSIEVDVFLTERFQRQAEITRYPVENGSSISDHIIYQPIGLDIDGLMGSGYAFDIKDFFQSAIDTHESIITLMNSKTAFDVVTGLKVYSNMVIENYSYDRNAANGGSFEFSMSLKEIFIVSSQTIVIPNSKLSGADPVTKKQVKQKVTVGKTTSGQTAKTDFISQIDAKAGSLLSSITGGS